MRTILRKVTCLLLALIALGVNNAWADKDVTVNGIVYRCYTTGEKKGTAEVTNGRSCRGNVTIYRDVDILSTNELFIVTSIGSSAFRNSGITSITLPNTLTHIGFQAFSGCTSLTGIVIPNSVTTIGDYAFQTCWGLTSLSIPSSVKTIGGAAFTGCSGLKKFTVEERNAYYCATDGHLFNKTKTELHSAVLPIDGTYTIPNSVTKIGERAFYRCSRLTNITIPNSLTAIGDYAFYGCSGLKEVYIDINYPLSSFSNHFDNCNSIETVYVRKKSDYSNEELSSVPSGVSIVELALDEFTLSKEGYGTMYSRYPFILPEGYEAGIITGTDRNALVIDYTYHSGDTVPNETAVLIKTESSSYNTHSPMLYPDNYDGMQRLSAENMLYGSLENIQMKEDENCYFYKLSYDQSGNNIGFYWGKEDGAAFENPTNKAYLKLPKQMASRTGCFLLDNDIVTSIEDIRGMQTDDYKVFIYDLCGRKLITPTKGGIYIKDGKKYIMK